MKIANDTQRATYVRWSQILEAEVGQLLACPSAGPAADAVRDARVRAKLAILIGLSDRIVTYDLAQAAARIAHDGTTDDTSSGNEDNPEDDVSTWTSGHVLPPVADITQPRRRTERRASSEHLLDPGLQTTTLQPVIVPSPRSIHVADLVDVVRDLIDFPQPEICRHHVAALLLDLIERSGHDVPIDLREGATSADNSVAHQAIDRWRARLADARRASLQLDQSTSNLAAPDLP